MLVNKEVCFDMDLLMRNTFFRAHQSHYEQMGEMNVSLKVGNNSYKLTNMPGFRDHSFGLYSNVKITKLVR